jgi:putative transposase
MGSRSAKRLLREVSGKESRHMRHVNHVVSKKIMAEAVRAGAKAVGMEDLTHSATASKRVCRCARDCSWAFR